MTTPTPDASPTSASSTASAASSPAKSSAPRMILVDTSGPICRVVYAEGPVVRVELRLDLGMTHSTRLSPAIRDVLETAGRTPEDIELWGAVRGPGSFTGLRIGVATVQGLALVTERPVLGLSTLAAFADSDVPVPAVVETEEAGPSGVLTLPLMDARNRRAYFAYFGEGGDGPARLTEDAVAGYEAVLDQLDALVHEGSYKVLRLVGDTEPFLADEDVRRALARYAPDLKVQSLPLASPAADAMVREAMRQVRAGETLPPERLEPAYLAPTQAERNLAKRQGE